MPDHYDVSPITGLAQDYSGWRDYLDRVIRGEVAAEGLDRIGNALRALGRRDPEGLNEFLGEFGFGGITSMPREALTRFAGDIIERTRGEGGVTTNPRTFRDPEAGVSVGGRVPGTELQAPLGEVTPEQLAQHMRDVPVNLDVEDWANVGGWLDEGREFYDISELFQGPAARHRATTEAARRGELASWDIGAGQEIRTPPGDVLQGLHFAHQPLETVDPLFAGSNVGMRGAERVRRQAPYNADPYAFFGSAREQAGVQPYGREQATGIHVHGAELPGIMNPATATPELRQQIGEQLAERLEGARDPLLRATEYERLLEEMGYYGFVNPQSGIIQVGRETPVDYLGALPPALRGPQGRNLSLFEGGGPRLPEMKETPLRGRRFARQRQAQELQFPVTEPTPARAPRTRVRLPATPKQGTRTTVIRPQRKQFPGIYQGEEQIMEQAARQWQPESPYLRDVFDLTRADIDLGYRAMEDRLGRSRGQPFAGVTATAADYPRQVMGGANTRRVRNILGMAASDPQFMGAYGWYWNEPLLQRYIEQLGPEEGVRQFRRFHQQGAALSPGSAVPKEIERASIYNFLARQGRPEEFLSGRATPAGSGAGHIYHSSAHRKALERALRTGTPFETNPLQAAKTKAYFGARTGENIWSPVMDAHFVRGIGLPDVRPTADIGSIGEREAGRIADWYSRQVAQPLGMGGVGAQALQWNILGPQTGVESPLGAGLMEIMADLAARKGAATGQSPREALDAFIRGEQDLFVPR